MVDNTYTGDIVMKVCFVVALSLLLTACAATVPVQTVTTKTDTLVTVQQKVIHDTTNLSPIYYGGQNSGCDTAAILAKASFIIAKQNSQGGVSLYKYNALLRQFKALNSIPPEKILIPGTNTTTLEVRKPGFWDYIKIGSVAIVLFIGLIVLGKGLLPLITKIPFPL